MAGWRGSDGVVAGGKWIDKEKSRIHRLPFAEASVVVDVDAKMGPHGWQLVTDRRDACICNVHVGDQTQKIAIQPILLNVKAEIEHFEGSYLVPPG